MSAYAASIVHRELVIVDTGLGMGSDFGEKQVLLLARRTGSLNTIAEKLAGFKNLDAIHLVTHGSPGAVQIGNGVLNETTVAEYAQFLNAVRQALKPQGELLLYGCNVGAGEAGVRLMELLSKATGAHVAASSTPTGAASRGGDWRLEKQVGVIRTAALSLPAYRGLLGFPFAFGGVNEVSDGDFETYSDEPAGIATDSDGNLVSVGTFLGASINFSPSNSLTDEIRSSVQDDSAEYTSDAFIARYDSDSGELLWVLTFGGKGYDKMYSVAAADGYIYVAGMYSTSTTITDSAGNTTVLETTDYIADNSDDSTDILLLKLTNDGVLVWAKSIGGSTGSDKAKAVAVDGSGNVYVGGYFKGTVDFDSDSSDLDDERTAASYYDSRYPDAFVAEYDADGAFKWVKRLGGAYADDVVNALYHSGSTLYVGGTITSAYYTNGTDNHYIQFDDNDADNEYDPYAAFSDGTGTEYGDNFGFVQSLNDADGKRNWYACFLDNRTGHSESELLSIAVDDSGNVYATGFFDNQVDFNPSTSATDLRTSSGGNNDDDIFVVKLDSTGGWVWSRTMGTSDLWDYGNAIRTSSGASPTIYLAGEYSGVMDADGQGSGTETLSFQGTLDAMLIALDADGNLEWAKSILGDDYDSSYSFATSASGEELYLAGVHATTSDLDPSTTGTYEHTTTDMEQEGEVNALDGWIVKLNSSGDSLVVSTVATTSASNVSSSGADTGGTASGSDITERGVCWNTAGNPSTSDTCKTSGSGSGSFSVSLSGLSSSTTYYVRAYAINSGGTGYGDVEQITTTAATTDPDPDPDPDPNPDTDTDTLSDNFLFWRHEEKGTMVYWRPLEDGTLDTSVDGSWGYVWDNALSTVWSVEAMMTVGDYTVLIWKNSDSGKVAYWKIGSDGSLINETENDGWGYVSDEYTVSSDWKLVGAKVIDDSPMLFWQYEDTTRLAYWRLTTDCILESGDDAGLVASGESASESWSVIGMTTIGSDYTVIWRNLSTNVIYYWQLDDDGLFTNEGENVNWGKVYSDTSVDSDWSLVSIGTLSGYSTMFWYNDNTGKVAYWKVDDNATIIDTNKDSGWGIVNDSFSVGSQWEFKSLLTVDDSPHLLWYNSGEEKVVLWSLDDSGSYESWFSVNSDVTPSSEWELYCVKDKD